jgi:hypothetical protein
VTLTYTGSQIPLEEEKEYFGCDIPNEKDGRLQNERPLKKSQKKSIDAQDASKHQKSPRCPKK